MPTIPSALADDPVAAQTSWEPLKGGGANFKTRRLVPVSADRLEFPATWGIRLFGGVFTFAGLAASAAAIAAALWWFILFGLVFVVVGVALWRYGTTPVVFDRRQDAFWRGRTAPNEVRNRAELKHYAPLDEIHALQIVREHISSKDGSYWSFELNLVLRDGRRLNVMDHGDYDALRHDADTLAEFLGRPVWDAVGGS
jgi:hypothetical protein